MAEKKHSLPTRIVDKFLEGNLSVILILLAVVAGAAALLLTPREEEPQIVVPLADVYVQMPGASAEEVEKLVSTPLEKLLYQIDGVEYVYSMSQPGHGDRHRALLRRRGPRRPLVKLHNKISTHTDMVPPGVTGWVVKPVEIDDVPIVNFTLYAGEPHDYQLRRVAEEVVDRLQSVKNTNVTTVIGGRPRQIRVELDPQALAARGLAPARSAPGADRRQRGAAGRRFDRGNDGQILVRGGAFLPRRRRWPPWWSASTTAARSTCATWRR